MLKNFLLILSILSLFACSVSEKETISGTISNGKNGEWIFLEKLSLSDVQKVDSCQVINEQFSFAYNTDSINFYRISLSNQNYGLVALQKGDTIQFKAEASSLASYQTSGSKEMVGISQLLNIINSIQPKTDSLRVVYQESVGTIEETVVLEKVREAYDNIIDQQKKNIEQFIDNNPDLFINLIALQQLGEVAENLNYYKKVAEKLDSLYPNNFWIKDIKDKISSEQNTAIGVQAPNFIINDIKGNSFELSSLRGSYVLLDFWASWCAPCRRENPLIVDLYNTYHPMGLEIVGISLDDITQKSDAKLDWAKAVKQDGLQWKQVSQLQGFESPVCKAYGISSIPSTFLLDKNGVIIARNLRGTILANQLKDIFE